MGAFASVVGFYELSFSLALTNLFIVFSTQSLSPDSILKALKHHPSPYILVHGHMIGPRPVRDVLEHMVSMCTLV